MEKPSPLGRKPNQQINVLFIAEIEERIQKYLKQGLNQINNLNLIFPKKADQETLLDLASEANVIIGWRSDEEIMKKAKNTEIFICPGAGVKHLIDLFKELNKERDVILINNHGNSYNVAQHTMALLLSYMNKVIPHHKWMKDGRWRTGDEDAASILLRFRKIGLLGYGAINTKVHKFLHGFDVEFHVLKKDWQKKDYSFNDIEKRYTPNQLNQFLNVIDILIIAVPETSSTIGLIGLEELKLLRKNAILINVSRGSIVDEESLYKALKNNLINGAAIDVWYERHPEPNESGKSYPYHYPFHELENIILSPHRGYSPFEDLLRWDPIIENLKRIARGRTDLLNVVDLSEEY
jgi:phosphoglycerate dehydrogenase-like enzyme